LTFFILWNLEIDLLILSFFRIRIFKENLFGIIFSYFCANFGSNLSLSYLSFGKKRPVIFQAGKFATIGVSNTLIDWRSLNFLILLTGIPVGLYYSIFKGFLFS